MIKLGLLLAALLCSLWPLTYPTYYSLFRVHPNTSQSEIVAVTRQYTRRLTGDEEYHGFIQNVASTLADSKLKKAYNSYGDLFEGGRSTMIDDLLVQSLTMSALWAVTTYITGWLLMSPSTLKVGRKTLALWCILAFCLEVRTRVFQDTLNVGSTLLLPFQIAQLLRSSVILAFVLSMMISDVVYANTEESMRAQVNNLLRIQTVTLAHLQVLAKHSGVDVMAAMAPPPNPTESSPTASNAQKLRRR